MRTLLNMQRMQLTPIFTLAFAAALTLTGCPNPDPGTTEGTSGTAETDVATASTSEDETEAPCSNTLPTTTTDVDPTTTGADTDADSTGGLTVETSDTTGDEPATDSGEDPTTGGPIDPGVCHLNECVNDADCDHGAECFAAVEALGGVKTCSIPCETNDDCGNACEADQPASYCSMQGICEPILCRVGQDDCDCEPWIDGIMVCM